MPWPSCICLRSSLIELFLWASDWSPEPLCLSSSHFFLLYIIHYTFLQGNRSGVNIFHWQNHPSSFFITLTPFFGHRCLQQFAHNASLSTESSKMWEELWLFNWLKGSWWRNINKPPHIHLIPFRFKISSMMVHLFGPSTFSKFDILIDTDIIQIILTWKQLGDILSKINKEKPTNAQTPVIIVNLVGNPVRVYITELSCNPWTGSILSPFFFASGDEHFGNDNDVCKWHSDL